MACLLEALGLHDPIGLIKMASCATFDALDAFAFLPQLVRGVGLVSFAIGFVYAAAADEGGENAFVGTFVYREVAFAAFEVACRFLVRVLISCRWMLVLNGNDAGPGGFFPTALVTGRSGSGASCSRSSQLSLSLCSMVSVVSPWWTRTWQVWH